MRSRAGVYGALGAVAAVLVLLLLASPAAAQNAQTPSPDVTVYRIDVHADGNATWTVELRRRLPNEEDRAGFERFADDVRSGDVTVFEGIERDMRPLVEEAENATGRPMEAVGFQRRVDVRDTVTGTQGVTSVSFTWTAFAADRGRELVMGDVFAGSGLTIGEDERLVVEHDDGLTVTEVVPEPDATEDGVLQWEGERFFEEHRPRVVFAGGDGILATIRGLGLSIPSVAAAFVVLLSGFFGGLFLGRRFGLIDGADERHAADEAADEELLTDQDRVVRLLRQRDGRMKQAEIVESTGWSKSKVSMVLSEMEDDDVISKLRLGRENVIDLEQD